MMLGEEYRITNWFVIHFVENNGMAFGMELGGRFGKIALSIFRIIAVAAIGWVLFRTLRKPETTTGLMICGSLIFAGAIGNIIDSVFYGLIFTESYMHAATFTPIGEGYAPFLHGRVVDMFYFPLVEGIYPKWFPFGLAGKTFIFFRPVFNIADSAISAGIISVFIFQKKIFKDKNKENEAVAGES